MNQGESEFIKIQVVRADGQLELITLTGPIRISGRCIVSSTGYEHFFTESGVYDGWGMPFSIGGVPEDMVMEEVMPVIEAIEKDREIVDPKSD